MSETFTPLNDFEMLESQPRSKQVRTKERDGRRLPSNEPRCYEVSELRSRHYRVIEMSFLGYANIYIADFFDITPANVCDILNSQLSKDHIEILRAQRDASSVDIAKQLKALAPEAVRLMRTSLVRENERLSLDPDAKLSGLNFKIAQDVLDRDGHQPPKQGQQLHLHLTGEDLKGLKADAEHKCIHSPSIDESCLPSADAISDITCEEV